MFLSTIRRLFLKFKKPALCLHVGIMSEKDFDPRIITKHSIRAIEQTSIKEYVALHKNLLTGRVLDFGSGTQPYRQLVSGEYVPFEKGELFPGGTFDAVLMNQVVQYLHNPKETFQHLAKVGKHLVMTYPTNWEEVESDDWHRFTKKGMERILLESGYTIIEHKKRCSITFINFELVLGYGVVAESQFFIKKENHT